MNYHAEKMKSIGYGVAVQNGYYGEVRMQGTEHVFYPYGRVVELLKVFRSCETKEIWVLVRFRSAADEYITMLIPKGEFVDAGIAKILSSRGACVSSRRLDLLQALINQSFERFHEPITNYHTGIGWLPVDGILAYRDYKNCSTPSLYRGIFDIKPSGSLEIWRQAISGCLGKLRLQELDNLTIQNWVNRIAMASPSSGRPISEKMQKNILANLRAAMDKAVLVGTIPKNPCVGVEVKRTPKNHFETYSMEEISKLLSAVKGTELELGIHIELCLGLRRGELLALRLSDIDWENNKITVTKSRVCDRGQVIEKEPKTFAGKRALDVPAQLMEMLRKRHLQIMEQKLAHGSAFPTDPYA